MTKKYFTENVAPLLVEMIVKQAEEYWDSLYSVDGVYKGSYSLGYIDGLLNSVSLITKSIKLDVVTFGISLAFKATTFAFKDKDNVIPRDKYVSIVREEATSSLISGTRSAKNDT